MKTLVYVMVFLFVSFETGIANWNGPVTIIQGQWGSADNQFGLHVGDSFDEIPSLDGILGNGNIVISDLVNKRTLVFKADGNFKEKENWIEQPAAGGMIKYMHSRYLLGCCVQGFDASGNLWTGGGTSYALTDNNGNLLSKVNIRPLELGKVTEKLISGTQKKITIQFPDRTWSYVGISAIPYMRDISGNLYGYGARQVIRYTTCGREAASLMMPDVVGEGYGPPVIGPNGDVYTWKQTDAAYSIIKWTWVNDPTPPANAPDAPASLKVTAVSSGLGIKWQQAVQDPGCVTGYEIVRTTTSGGPFTALATVNAGTADTRGWITYSDSTAAPGTTYYYKVRAVAGTEYSPFSAEVSGAR